MWKVRAAAARQAWNASGSGALVTARPLGTRGGNVIPGQFCWMNAPNADELGRCPVPVARWLDSVQDPGGPEPLATMVSAAPSRAVKPNRSESNSELVVWVGLSRCGRIHTALAIRANTYS